MSCDSTLFCYPTLSNFLSPSFTYSILSYLFLLNHVSSYSNLFSVISFLWPNLFLSPIFIFSYTLFYLPLIIYPFVYLCLSYRFLPYKPLFVSLSFNLLFPFSKHQSIYSPIYLSILSPFYFFSNKEIFFLSFLMFTLHLFKQHLSYLDRAYLTLIF